MCTYTHSSEDLIQLTNYKSITKIKLLNYMFYNIKINVHYTISAVNYLMKEPLYGSIWKSPIKIFQIILTSPYVRTKQHQVRPLISFPSHPFQQAHDVLHPPQQHRMDYNRIRQVRGYPTLRGSSSPYPSPSSVSRKQR